MQILLMVGGFIAVFSSMTLFSACRLSAEYDHMQDVMYQTRVAKRERDAGKVVG